VQKQIKKTNKCQQEKCFKLINSQQFSLSIAYSK
jgi:hypothetical protein